MPEFQFSKQVYFPFDDAEKRLDETAIKLGLTPENFALAEEENEYLAHRVQDKLVGLQRQAGLADNLTESIAYLQKNEAKLEDLEIIARRAEELEAYTKELIIPWTRSQLVKSLPWLLVALMIAAFGVTAIASRSTSTQQNTEIKQ